MFIPPEVQFLVGSFEITPLRGFSIFLCVFLLLNKAIRWAWPDTLMFITFILGLVSFSSGQLSHVGPALEAQGRSFVDLGTAWLVGRYLAEGFHRLRAALTLLVTTMSVFAPLLLLECLFQFNLHEAFWGAFAPVQGLYDEQRLGIYRAMGWTSHPIMLGIAYTMVLPIALYAALYDRQFLGPAPGLKALLIAMGIFLSLSSGAWTAGLIVVALVLWERYFPRPMNFKWGLIFIGGPLLYYSADLLSGRPLMRILMMKMHISSPTAWFYRWQLRERVLDEMPGHWWWGHGLDLPAAFTGPFGWSIDNNYLSVMFYAGIVGLAGWIALQLAAVFCGWRDVWLRDHGRGPLLARHLGFGVVALMLAQYSVALFSTGNLLLWLMLGMTTGVALTLNPERRGMTCRMLGHRCGLGRRIDRFIHNPKRPQLQPENPQ
ncbi:MAG: O-antigen ligase family protein [Algisphaera sp.]